MADSSSKFVIVSDVSQTDFARLVGFGFKRFIQMFFNAEMCTHAWRPFIIVLENSYWIRLSHDMRNYRALSQCYLP